MALPNLRIDGLWTMETRKAMQRHMAYRGWYTRAMDGDFGIESKKGLQRMLRYYGWYTRAIDGDFGHYSRYALYNMLYTTWGSYSYLGKTTQAQYYAAPWWAWTAADEDFVKEVTRAIQSGLNRHGHY